MFETVLTILHVGAAILLLGPVAVAVSMFPRAAADARNAGPEFDGQHGRGGGQRFVGQARLLHRISRSYGMISMLVPLIGAAVLFLDWDTYKSQGQFHASLALALIAWLLLLFVVIPQQRKLMGALGELDPSEADPEKDYTDDFEKSKKTATIAAGIFNLLWVIVLVLMFI
ncbi:DUF2269 domain-containing protein [Corynebacterium aquatimens]|uniref:DUF2269 domain-containing protein n=1 Tax=Corynebacterium aquatimens TaxID=1190508 RepID=A0A931E0F7_9CORY|nr:DUF2269 domain-containing protein [Corynebacterium aquatimens]MBG6121330.1 hypothetical protein [Corynebacterium aquatimens]WJY66123.1 hypothetical protein CAQUA_07125 [Corynebacterium aquatimens]